METKNMTGINRDSRSADVQINGKSVNRTAVFSNLSPATDEMNEEKSASFVRLTDSNGEWRVRGSVDLLHNVGGTPGAVFNKIGGKI